jgi:hypothetical protein
MTTDKRGISALLLQRQLGIRRYETAWLILHKLRRAMVNVGREALHGDVEIDDTWIGAPKRPASWRPIGRALGGPGHREPATVAHRDVPWGRPPPPAGVSRRVRVPA